MTKTENFARIEIDSIDALWEWMAENHGQTDSVWLVTWKKDTPTKYLSTSDVLDALIAHGWIDGIRRKHEDPLRTMQLIAPRKMQAWAKSYKDRAEKLRKEGRMHEAGEAAIAEAKSNGMWVFYDDVDALIDPEDLSAALAQDTFAQANYAASPPAYRRNLLRWIKLAKTQPTRAKRIAAIVDAARDNRRIPQM